MAPLLSRLMESYFGRLSAFGMGFAMTGKQVVGPRFLALDGVFVGVAGGASGRLRGILPILWRIGNSPYIPVIVERDSDQKIFPVISERKTIRHAGGSASASGQIAQQYWCFERQRVRRTQSSPLGAHDERNTHLSERVPAIHAGYSNGNLHAHSRAAPGRFRCEYFHLRYSSGGLLFVNTSLTEPGSDATLRKGKQ
jgi:hypothetical protein